MVVNTLLHASQHGSPLYHGILQSGNPWTIKRNRGNTAFSQSTKQRKESFSGGVPPYKEDGFARPKFLKRTPKRYQGPDLWAWLEIFSAPEEVPILKQHIISYEDRDDHVVI